MNPFVSVIVPVYKVERFIERCARSLFSQTFENVEFVFVDDCTPDTSIDILNRVLDEFPSRSSQVTVLHNEVNKGLPFSRRRGAEIASGDYIIHCDSDDWVEPEMCEKLWNTAVQQEADLVLCGYFIEQDEKQLKRIINADSKRDLMSGLLSGAIPGYTWNKLVKRDIYRRLSIFPKDNMWEDKVLSVQEFFYCNHAVIIEDPLYHYRLNSEGISLSRQVAPKVSQLEASVALIVSFLDEKGLTEKYRWEISAMKAEVQMFALPLPRKQYLAVYPENHFRQLLNPYVPFARKAGHLTKLLGIHGISGVFRRK